ncbi:hypothetical protein [Nostoc sp. 'Peltigera membranacea cyanobiont' 210A]|uniref:hypothetical protein n=1 Tax=Nostoc sp. 'Peltigera membranacea cyanobiont' 210A TaxID=2014529 RepID=UPI001CB9A81C|nr:hypothetical protein [Nostoc sp. 'Peltigera membranacea cyanobiont' 210A]
MNFLIANRTFLTGAEYDSHTQFTEGFDPDEVGAELQDEDDDYEDENDEDYEDEEDEEYE